VINFQKPAGTKVLELGGGNNRQEVSDCNVDVRPGPKVDFTADFNKPLPIASDEWNVVISLFAIEHVSYTNVPLFLKEIFRVLKPGGKAVLAMPNTEEQLKWIQNNYDGWDGHNAFESCSCLLYGDQRHSEREGQGAPEIDCHKAYFSPNILTDLLSQAGFENIVISPYNERKTDMVVECSKPKEILGKTEETSKKIESPNVVRVEENKSSSPLLDTSEQRFSAFDKHYFNGGRKVGGYANEGYRDFPVHEITLQHLLKYNPASVLEVGCARGYLVKRLQDRGIRACGLEISNHCWLTRACDGVINFDICDPSRPWPFKTGEFDLSFSIAVLEHVPERYLGHVLSEMARVSKRTLHGIDLGKKDDGFDKTHVTLRDVSFWQSEFQKWFPRGNTYLLDKEELERGEFPKELLEDKGRLKLNVGSFTTMHHYGWLNLDIHNLKQWADGQLYRYQQVDVKNGLPFKTATVDAIFSSHMLEHLTYDEGLAFLRECRRVIKPDGVMRLIVPDAHLLMSKYTLGKLSEFDEINDNCEKCKTEAGKLWSLLHEGHASCYDQETLANTLDSVGFCWFPATFRTSSVAQDILKETVDMLPCLSLYMDAKPKIV
jgi:predicted SAM-dependent methyltransferase